MKVVLASKNRHKLVEISKITEKFDIETMYTKIQAGCQTNSPSNLKVRQKWNWLSTFVEQKKKKCLNCCKEQKQRYAGESYEF